MFLKFDTISNCLLQQSHMLYPLSALQSGLQTDATLFRFQGLFSARHSQWFKMIDQTVPEAAAVDKKLAVCH